MILSFVVLAEVFCATVIVIVEVRIYLYFFEVVLNILSHRLRGRGMRSLLTSDNHVEIIGCKTSKSLANITGASHGLNTGLIPSSKVVSYVGHIRETLLTRAGLQLSPVVSLLMIKSIHSEVAIVAAFRYYFQHAIGRHHHKDSLEHDSL